MAALALVLGYGLFFLGLVALFRPLPKLHLPTRARAGIAIVLGLFVASLGLPSEERVADAPVSPQPATATAQPTAPTSEPAPVTPEDQVRRGVGTKYRDPVDVMIESRRVLVSFNIADNLTENMIRRGAQMAVKGILEGVHASGFDYEYITVQGSFPMADRFGNSERSVVVNVGYARSTVDRINWPNMLTENIYAVADRVALHPTFRPQQ